MNIITNAMYNRIIDKSFSDANKIRKTTDSDYILIWAEIKMHKFLGTNYQPYFCDAYIKHLISWNLKVNYYRIINDCDD